MTAVWGLKLPDSEKIVLLALADCANDEGVCWPSVASLVKKCSKSDRTIQAAVKALAAAGHLTRDERPGKGVLYTIHPAPEGTAGREDCGAKRLPPETAARTPEAASDKPSRTPKPSSEASPPTRTRARWPKTMPPPEGVSAEQWAGFIDHRKAKRAPLTPRAYDLLVKKLAKHAAVWPPGWVIDLIVERSWTAFEEAWVRRVWEETNDRRDHSGGRSGWAARPGAEGLEPASLDD